MIIDKTVATIFLIFAALIVVCVVAILASRNNQTW